MSGAQANLVKSVFDWPVRDIHTSALLKLVLQGSGAPETDIDPGEDLKDLLLLC